MADRTALGMIGLMLGVATIMVVTVGALVIGGHLNGRLQLEDDMRISDVGASSVR